LRPGSPAIIRERVSSANLHLSDAEIEEDAFANAQNVIEQRLAELDPPLKYRPSLNEVKTEYIRKDSRSTRPPSEAVKEVYKNEFANEKIDPDKLKYVEYDVEVTADQIRDLRTRDRITLAFRVFAGLTCVAMACFLFLRADEWTKGYLTHWLAFAAVALAGGAAAALFLV
jgi:hypothetical protein